MGFYDRVKKLVKERTSFTLRSFIESLEINYDSYNGQKRYNNLPRADEAYKIAQALNTTVEYLVTGVESDTAKRELEELKRHLVELGRS